MTNEDESAPPALFEHCVRTYNAMLEEATRIESSPEWEEDGAGGPATHIIVYEGFFTTLITGKLNLSVPYYSSVKNALIRMGCIKQLRRGGSTTPSQWELCWEPNVESFMKTLKVKPKMSASKDNDTEGQLRQQINDLSQRLSDVEKWQGDVNKTLIRKLGTEEVQSA